MSIEASIPKTAPRRETVQEKGLRLYRAGRVRHLHDDVYEVRGDHGTYEVDARKRTCPCDSRLYCSHRAGVEVAKATRRCRHCGGLGAFWWGAAKHGDCGACFGTGRAA